MTEMSVMYIYDLKTPQRDTLWRAVEQQKPPPVLNTTLLEEIRLHQQRQAPKPPTKYDLTLVSLLLPPISVASTPTHTSTSTPTNNASSWMCAICLDNLQEKNPNNISCSTCQFCQECLFEYIKVQIEEKTSHMTSHWTIRCPCLMENCELNTTDIERIIENLDEEYHNQKVMLVDKFRRFALDLEVQNDLQRTFCPQRDCTGVVTIPEKRGYFFASHQAKCQDCKNSFCTQCKRTHSRFATCDSASEAQFKKWRASTRQGCKKCPGCKIYIEKNEGCSHMTCRSCGTHFCWHCLGNVHDDNVRCKVMTALDSELWGESTPVRTITKTLAIPGGLAAGGLVIGAAVAGAGLAVAAGSLYVCASPVVAGYRYYRRRRDLILNEQLYLSFRQENVFLQGIVIVFPSNCFHIYSHSVDSLVANMKSLTVPTPSSSDDNHPPSFRVAYSRHVLYFTSEVNTVPGFEEDDYPLEEDDREDFNFVNKFGDLEIGIRPVMTARRSYIKLTSEFARRSLQDDESSAICSRQLSNALDFLYLQQGSA
jgi:hypothetical protein